MAKTDGDTFILTLYKSDQNDLFSTDLYAYPSVQEFIDSTFADESDVAKAEETLDKTDVYEVQVIRKGKVVTTREFQEG